MNTIQDPGAQQKAPEIYLRSYEDKDELYFEEYCRGLGDPDYYGYPGEPKNDNQGGNNDQFESIPF